MNGARVFGCVDVKNISHPVKMQRIRNSFELERYIEKNCPVAIPASANFGNLTDVMKKNDYFFENVVPHIQTLSKKYPLRSLLQKLSDRKKDLILTRMEIACLLANGFFCSFHADSYYDSKDINFYKLYDKSPKSARDWKVTQEKIRCLILYFEVFKQRDPTELVHFQRIDVTTSPDWKDSDVPMGSFIVIPNLSISEGFSMSQVVFSNKQIGGGVLSHGTLQEEIRFITCPELIVAKLFCPLMMDKEAVVIQGVQQYTDYEGYADTFKCCGGLLEGPLIGPHSIVAIDALDFSRGKPYKPDDQYSKSLIDRELLKAFAGFCGTTNSKSVVTGNWGGGCFKGDPILKAKIQWIASSYIGLHLYYYTYKYDEKYNTTEILEEMVKKCKDKTVGEMYKLITQ